MEAHGHPHRGHGGPNRHHRRQAAAAARRTDGLPPAPAAHYAQGRENLRHYQDAAIRAAIEKIIRERITRRRVRVLLSLATGSGKTRFAGALLPAALLREAFGGQS